jgi:hypothetical protein
MLSARNAIGNPLGQADLDQYLFFAPSNQGTSTFCGIFIDIEKTD